MQKVTLLCVGKMKEKFYIEAAAEYTKRLSRCCRLTVIELPEERLPESPSAAQIEGALLKEAEAVRAKLPPSAPHVAFTATIYDAETRRQNFGMVSNAFIRIYNEDTGEELLRYDLGEDFSIETAVVFGELYKNNGEWKFNAIGSGFQGGLAALCGHYGIDVA